MTEACQRLGPFPSTDDDLVLCLLSLSNDASASLCVGLFDDDLKILVVPCIVHVFDMGDGSDHAVFVCIFVGDESFLPLLGLYDVLFVDEKMGNWRHDDRRIE